MNTPPTYMTELEEQLGRDDSGALRASLCARLGTLLASLQAELRRIHPPDRFRQLQAAARATEAALQTLRTVYVPRPDGTLSGPVPGCLPAPASLLASPLVSRLG